MRSVLCLTAVAALLLTANEVQAQSGGQCGGGMQSARGSQLASAGVTGSFTQGAMSPSLFGPTQAYLQSAAMMSARQSQERARRVAQHNAVYQERREQLVAARQSALGRVNVVQTAR